MEHPEAIFAVLLVILIILTAFWAGLMTEAHLNRRPKGQHTQGPRHAMTAKAARQYKKER